MSEQSLFVRLEDLIVELAAGGITQREAALQIIREIENQIIFVLDPHKSPWSGDSVLKWQTQFLQSLADWKPGARPPAMQAGTANYLSHLRYCRFKQRNPHDAGRPEQHDWSDAEMYAMELYKAKGDPTNRSDQVEGWRSRSDMAKEVLKYLDRRAEKTGVVAPEFNTVRNKVPGWLKKFCALN